MALTVTNAQISIQDGPLPAVNLTSGTDVGQFTPGADVIFALQSTAGIARAEYTLICPKYAGLNGITFEWVPGKVNAFRITMPSNSEVENLSTSAGIMIAVTVSDGVGSIASAYNYLQSKDSVGGEGQYAADFVIRAALPAYTKTGGTLTGNANGAITSAMADGQTPVVGDIMLLPPGIAASATDAGLWVITAVGSGSAVFTAVQALGWQNGQFIPFKAEIEIERGTLFALSTWVNTLAGDSNAVGTASFTLFPRVVVQQVTLTGSGNIAVNTVPIASATKTALIPVRQAPAGAGVANTIMYHPATNPTPGPLGTATTTIQAVIAAGTINSGDQSVLWLTIINQV